MLQQKELFCNTGSDTEILKLRAKFFEIMAVWICAEHYFS